MGNPPARPVMNAEARLEELRLRSLARRGVRFVSWSDQDGGYLRVKVLMKKRDLVSFLNSQSQSKLEENMIGNNNVQNNAVAPLLPKVRDTPDDNDEEEPEKHRNICGFQELSSWTPGLRTIPELQSPPDSSV